MRLSMSARQERVTAMRMICYACMRCVHTDAPLRFMGLETALLGAEGRTIGMAAECLAAAMVSTA